MTLEIRPLKSDDKAAWLPLWKAYLEFYQSSLDDDVTATTFARLIEDKRFFALAALQDGKLIGFAHCLTHPATWAINDYCYLEDLFVDPAVRGAGAGRALIESVYAEADKRGCAKVYWLTQEHNRTARQLYDKVATLSDFVQYRR